MATITPTFSKIRGPAGGGLLALDPVVQGLAALE